jgi:hypothetical protein
MQRSKSSKNTKTKFAKRGKRTSAVEVANVSPHGIWLLVEDVAHFLPFDQFPWFRDATIGQLTDVELPSEHHLYWPALDIDLAVDSLKHPELFPLVSSAGTPKSSPKQASTRSRR